MSDARWLDVGRFFNAAAEHFRMAVLLHEQGGFDVEGIEGYKSSMAFMHAMQSGYTSFEKGLERILSIIDEEKPSGPDWHADLIERARLPIEGRRPANLSEQAAEWAEKTRRFRHVATRNCNNFRPQDAAGPVDAAKKLAQVLPGELATFRDAIDPPSTAQARQPV